MAGDVSAGILAGTIELDDQFTSRVDRILEGVDSIDKKLGGMSEHGSAGFLQMTESIFSAEAALKAVEFAADLVKEAVAGVVEEGSKIANIESAYDHLAAGANLGYDAIARLREGTHGEITDLNLLKLENHDLAAGMVLSAKQMDTMTAGAFALSKATGQDLNSALESVNTALLTGRMRAVQMITGKIDLAKAEDAFADKVGLTAKQLSVEGKLEAERGIILEKMGQMTERLGVTTDGLGIHYEAVKVKFENYLNKLEAAVAASPTINAAFDAVAEAISGIADEDQQKRVTAIADKVDQLMIVVVGFAASAVDGAKLVIDTYYEVQNVFTHVVEGIRAITYVAENTLLGIIKIANMLPGSMHEFDSEIKFLTKDTGRLYDAMAQGEHAVEANRKAEEAWGVTADKLKGSVNELHTKLVAMRAGHDGTAAAAEKNATAHEKAAGSIMEAGKAADYAKHSMELEDKELTAAATEWQKYDELKVKHGGSTLAIQKQQAKDWMDDQLSKLDLTTKAWIEHYKAIMDMGHQMMDDVGISFDKLQKGSRAAANDAFIEAQKTLMYAIQHADQYSMEFIQKLREDKDIALDHLRNYGHESVNQLQKIQNKADDVQQHVLDLTHSSTVLLADLSKAEFEALGGEARIKQIEQGYKDNPGRRAGGSGTTGAHTQAEYYSMLQEQRDYLQLTAAAKRFKENGDDTLVPALGLLPASQQPTTGGLGYMVGGTSGWGSNNDWDTGNQTNIFNIDGSKDPKAVAQAVLNILGGQVTLGRQFSAPGR